MERKKSQITIMKNLLSSNIQLLIYMSIILLLQLNDADDMSGLQQSLILGKDAN